MKIIVLNGSPKGDMSVTMQSIHYAQKKFPRVEFKIIPIASNIIKIEKDASLFDSIMKEIKDSDGVLWAFPLYYMLVHSNYKRFIELVQERKAQNAFSGKYAAAYSTSIHFFDNTAHNYIHAVCDDIGMKYTSFYSAAMQDLMDEKQRKQIILFFDEFLSSVENKITAPRAYNPVISLPEKYLPGTVKNKIKTSGKKVLIITDYTAKDPNLKRMVERFSSSFDHPPMLINVNDISIKGGCLGCIQCGFDNQCVYGDSDDIKRIYNTEIKEADILVYALKIKDRFFSSRFKMFLDRGFLNTHQPRNYGKQTAAIVSGPLSQTPNIREIFQAYSEASGANYNGIITDESGIAFEIDGLLDGLAEKLVSAGVKNAAAPMTFLGTGGMKIFRDDLSGNLKFPFQADYKYFKKHGLFDFPRENLRVRLFNFFMILITKIPSVRESIRKNMKSHMVLPFQEIISREKD